MSIRDLSRYFRDKNILFPLVLVVINILLWYPALKFWFFLSWEQYYLVGICGAKFNFICMMQSHGILYLINYKLFGWNATGWYLTAIILFTITVLLLYKLADLITKNTTIAFITAALFSANVAHNDVVNFGSFTGHYALIFASLLLGIFAYRRFSLAFESKKNVSAIFWYLLMLLSYSLGLFVREAALVFPFWVLFFELFSKGFRLSGKYFFKLVKIFTPLGVFSIGYIFLRQKYGGSPNDLIDAMVQLRMALLAQGLYGQYVWRGVLAFGKFAGSHLIPYPIMNIIREFIGRFFYPPTVNSYFFSVAGIGYTALLVSLIWFYRKIKKTRNLLLFSFLWFLVPTIFFSFAFSIDDYALVQPYGLDTTRWRYFAFFGTVLFWITIFWQIYKDVIKKGKVSIKKIQYFFLGAALVIASVNFYYLRLEQKARYLSVYKPARDFYTSFFQNFKVLPKDYIFYLAQGSNPLGDYILEWYFTRQAYYPYLTEDRGREFGAGYMGMLLERFLNGSANFNSTFFLDYDVSKGVINRTEEARKVILNQREYAYPLKKKVETLSKQELAKKGEHQVDITLDPKLHVEIPYKFEVSMRARRLSGSSSVDYTPIQKAFLETYARNRINYLEIVEVTVCATAPAGSQGKPATHLVKEHLVDGNINSRSLWAADCRPAWIVLDLGRVKRIGAIGFNGIDVGPYLPSDYTIFVSMDNKEWEKVVTVDRNELPQRIDKFPKVATARYVKFEVGQTSQGGMATISEIEVFDEASLPVLEFYGNDLSKLIEDSRNFGQGYMRFSWETDPDNDPPGKELVNKSTYVPIKLDGFEHRYVVEPNEGEFYSSGGQFLKRFITSLHLDFVGPPSSIEVTSVRAIPKFPI